LKLGSIMQACRERAGLSQEEMAEKLNRSRSCISKFENDHKIPDVPTMMRWVDVTSAKEVMIAFMYGADGITMMQTIMGLF
jgi:transcriptional regulator with XRE-family HTH domain